MNRTTIAPLPPTASCLAMQRRPPSFIGALTLFWLRPHAYGPYLASASLGRAFAAHAVAVAIAAASAVRLTWRWAIPEYFSKSDLLTELQFFVLRRADGSAASQNPWLEPVLIIAAWPALHVSLLLLAVCIMPWVAAGDGVASVWRRSLRLTYWSTTILIPASAAAMLASWMWEDFPQRVADGDPITVIPLSLVSAVLLAMFVRVLFFGGHASPGMSSGAALLPREPRCDNCGYLLLGLPVEARCPECGTPAADSLPGGRRKPLAWHRNALKPRGVVDLLRLHVFIVHDCRFFQFVPVHGQLPIARYFWWMSFGVMCAIALLAAQVAPRFFPAHYLFRSNINAFAVGLLFLTFALHNVMMLPACLWAQLRHGIRDYRVSAAVCCYCVPLWWPFMATAMSGVVLMNGPIRKRLADLGRLELGFVTLDGVQLAVLAVAVLVVASLLFVWLRTCKALRTVRFANV